VCCTYAWHERSHATRYTAQQAQALQAMAEAAHATLFVMVDTAGASISRALTGACVPKFMAMVATSASEPKTAFGSRATSAVDDAHLVEETAVPPARAAPELETAPKPDPVIAMGARGARPPGGALVRVVTLGGGAPAATMTDALDTVGLSKE
jgi:hypothetical protein